MFVAVGVGQVPQAVAAERNLVAFGDDGTLTYRQLRNNAQTLAKHLRALDLPEIRLGVMARNGRGIITPLGAKGYAGAHIFLLNEGVDVVFFDATG